VQWITDPTITGYLPSHQTVHEMAEILWGQQAGYDLDVPSITELGKHWIEKFLKQHSELKTVVGKSIEKARIKGTSVNTLKKWFQAFEMTIIKDDEVLPKNIYNMDESCFSNGTINASQLIVNTKISQRYQANISWQEWVSMLKYICMDGTSISPMIIFKEETPLSNWVPNGLLKDWIF
jgi:hypothetical protein